jgi:hypothetical protein
MSKHETKMTRWYAKTRYPKGFLMEEYLALPQGKTNGKRLMDGVIVFRKPFVKRKLLGVCTEMDTVMHRMLRKHPKCRAVVYRAKKLKS